MGNIVTSTTPLATVRREGQDLTAYITQPWFRYLVGANPDGNGTTGEVLHGNSDGAPTWGPINLAEDVTGSLPVANGGIGDVTPVPGGVLTFTGPETLVASSELAENAIVFGGGDSAAPSTPLDTGSAGQTLHATPAGAPTWAKVSLNNFDGEVTGVLAITNGGTGTVAATGTGPVVLADNPTIVNATLQFPVLDLPVTLAGTTPGAVMNATDPRVVAVTAVATTLIAQDYTFFFIAHDKTSGGCSMGLMDGTGVAMVATGVANVTFSRAAGVGLQAAVTAGANPRSLSIFAIGIGPI